MSEREWRFNLDDMLRFAEKVRTCSAGVGRDTFLAKPFPGAVAQGGVLLSS
ncbi:MAG: hypothetical protein WBN68_02195 [Sedimenticolaceae bacterium]